VTATLTNRDNRQIGDAEALRRGVWDDVDHPQALREAHDFYARRLRTYHADLGLLDLR
jgi:hypothetical protein